MNRFVFFLIAVVLFAGCTDYRQIKVDNVRLERFEFKGTSSALITLKADVANPTGRTLSLETLEATLLRDGKEFAYFTLEDVPSAGPRSDSEILVPVKASVADPIAIIAAGLDMDSWDLDAFVVDGKLVIKSDGGVKKTVRLRKTPLRKLVESFK